MLTGGVEGQRVVARNVHARGGRHHTIATIGLETKTDLLPGEGRVG